MSDDTTNGYHANPVKAVTIAFVYGCCSLCMALLNKAVMNSYSFDFPVFLVTAQMIYTVALLETLSSLGFVAVPRYTFARGRSFLFPSIFYGIHSILSLSALSGMNIPMYGVIKRCSPVVILVMGCIFLRKSRPSLRTIIAVCMISCGCVIAGFGDLAHNYEAYACGLASVFSQATYLLLVQRYATGGGGGASSSSSASSSSDNAPLSAVETLHLNSVNILMALLTVHACYSGRMLYTPLTNLFERSGSDFTALFSMVTILIMAGCSLNYLVFLCTSYNSALTTSIVGTAKSVIQTAIGIFTFGGIAVNAYTIGGICINMLGGMFYTYTKYSESKRVAGGAAYSRLVNRTSSQSIGSGDKSATAHSDNAVPNV